MISMERNYIDLNEWMQHHPRLTALVEYLPDNPNIGKIIAESNNPAVIHVQYDCMDDKENHRIIP